MIGKTLGYYADLAFPIVTALTLIAISIEWILLTIENKMQSHKEGLVNLYSGMLTFFPVFAITKLGMVGFMYWLFQFKIFNFGFQWYVWVLTWFAYDFMFWLIHFISHNVRLFWCFHSVHHTPKEMKLTVAFRGSFMDFLLNPHFIIWLPLLGFHPLIIIIVETIGRSYGIFIHVNETWVPNTKRSFIEKIFISPSTHRVHHSVNHIYLDRNYGESFAFWDLLFRTFQPEISSEKPVYGTMRPIDPENLMDIQTNEFKALWEDVKNTPRWLDKLKYVFKPPGWNHIDGGILASEMRAIALNRWK